MGGPKGSKMAKNDLNKENHEIFTEKIEKNSYEYILDLNSQK